MKSLSHVQLFATPWTVAYQAPPSIEFSRQENWSGLPFPSPGDLPNPGIELKSPILQADALPSEPPGKLSCSVLSKSLWPHGLYPPGSSVHAILQARILEWLPCPLPGYLPNPGIEPRSPALQADSLHLSHQGSPRILEWVAYPFSRVSSQLKNWTTDFGIAGRFFTSWATREAYFLKNGCL